MENTIPRVLIVDDQPHFRRQLRALLAHAGLTTVAEAGSIAEARTILRSTPVDLAIVDVMLPGMNGIVGVLDLKIQMPALRIILVSAYNLEAFRRSAQQIGAEAFVPKDELDLDLVRAWRQAETNQKTPTDQEELQT